MCRIVVFAKFLDSFSNKCVLGSASMALEQSTRITCYRILICASVTICVLLIKLPGLVESGGKRLSVEDEPTSKQAIKIFHLLLADKRYFALEAAGILQDEEIPHFYDRDLTRSNPHVNSTFGFHSSDLLQKISIANWYTPLMERSALHVYDDPKDIELATGPQVDQRICGLHLDYMHHMAQKHMRNFANSTELSIFLLMNSFATPHLGVAEGSTIFPGNYETCVQVKLNMIKSELDQVDPEGSAEYFSSKHGTEPQTNGVLNRVLTTLRQSIGPFIGGRKNHDKISISKHNQTLRMQTMRYCMAGLRWPHWGNSSFERRNFVYRTGICLPDTCDTKSLDLYHDKIKRLVDIHMSKFHDGYYIDQLYCIPDEKSPLRNPFNYMDTVSCIAFHVAWLSVVLIVTVYACFRRLRRRASKMVVKTASNDEGTGSNRSSWLSILEDFDLVRNYRAFISLRPSNQNHQDIEKTKSKTKEKGPRINLEPLEGIKFFASLSVIHSHEAMVHYGTMWNPEKIARFQDFPLICSLASAAPAIVNIFFVVTGLVTAKMIFSTSRNLILKPGFWLKFLIFRYIRVVPLYLLVHWFLKTTFRFLYYGPFWDFGTSHTAWSKVCQDESYWSVILPSANNISPGQHCNGVGWYIANDIQASLFTPVVMILLYKRPKLGYLLVAVSIIAASLNHVSYYFSNEEDPWSVFRCTILSLTRVTFETFVGYTALKFRFVAYFIGLLAGHLLYLYEKGTIKRWPKWFIVTGNSFSFTCAYLVCLACSLYSLLLVYDNETLCLPNAILEGTHHTITSLAIASFLILLCTGHHPRLARFFGQNFFRIIAKMSLSTTLIHMPIIYYKNMTIKFQNYLEEYFYEPVIFQIFECFIGAFIFYLFYEVPLRKLTMRCFKLNGHNHKSSERKSE